MSRVQSTQEEKANLLKAYHIKGDPLVLYNIWDAGSAAAMQEVGAKAIATGSWSVATAHGFDDGEKLPFDLVLTNLKRILTSVDIPVTIDIEGGYGRSPMEVQSTINKVIEAGAVGINFEDQMIDEEVLFSVEEQCARIKAIRTEAGNSSIPLFINARTDLFLKSAHTEHYSKMDEAIHRATSYADAGADGFFAPGLRSPREIEQLCEFSPIPVNIMIMSDSPSPKQLADLGVARISYGPEPYFKMLDVLKAGGRQAFCLN